jgi:hypothetical protein
VIVPNEITAPATTHITGTNQRLDPMPTASFRHRTTESYPMGPHRKHRVGMRRLRRGIGNDLQVLVSYRSELESH